VHGVAELPHLSRPIDDDLVDRPFTRAVRRTPSAYPAKSTARGSGRTIQVSMMLLDRLTSTCSPDCKLRLSAASVCSVRRAYSPKKLPSDSPEQPDTNLPRHAHDAAVACPDFAEAFSESSPPHKSGGFFSNSLA